MVFEITCWMNAHHLALHCLADLRCSREAIRDHWFFPYFITAALRISSCVNDWLRQTQMQVLVTSNKISVSLAEKCFFSLELSANGNVKDI